MDPIQEDSGLSNGSFVLGEPITSRLNRAEGYDYEDEFEVSVEEDGAVEEMLEDTRRISSGCQVCA
jgi:hypothetical protein